MMEGIYNFLTIGNVISLLIAVVFFFIQRKYFKIAKIFALFKEGRPSFARIVLNQRHAVLQTAG
jgi:hypothetical protein